MPQDPVARFRSPNPVPLQAADFERAAIVLESDIAAIRAVVEVESIGHGFQSDARPKLLFERHVFHRETGGRWSGLHPAISSPQPGGYAGGPREYRRLEQAMALDRRAALRSSSWGGFQIMGFNHQLAGFETVEQFVAGMVESAARQIDAFVAFVRASGLQQALQAHDWAAFARGYNGPAYRSNRYDERLAAAYLRFGGAAGPADARGNQLLTAGSRGEEVRRLQRYLGILADGIFGPVTVATVKDFQRRRGLAGDGIVGPRTWELLLAS